MADVVVFSVTDFIAYFPHLGIALKEGRLTEEQITAEFEVVCNFLGGAGAGSPYPYNPANGVMVRKYALYYATCHLLTLDLWPAGQNGRITSASQGSVSTSFDLLRANSFTAQWWTQTPCGARFWALTAAYRKGGRVYAGGHYHPWG